MANMIVLSLLEISLTVYNIIKLASLLPAVALNWWMNILDDMDERVDYRRSKTAASDPIKSHFKFNNLFVLISDKKKHKSCLNKDE